MGWGLGGRCVNSPSKNAGVSVPPLLQGHLPNPRIQPASALQEDSSPSHQGSPRKKQSPKKSGTGWVAGEAGGLAGKVAVAPGRARNVVTEGTFGFLMKVFGCAGSSQLQRLALVVVSGGAVRALLTALAFLVERGLQAHAGSRHTRAPGTRRLQPLWRVVLVVTAARLWSAGSMVGARAHWLLRSRWDLPRPGTGRTHVS